MLKPRRQLTPEGTVLVVSSNAETLDGLHEYLSQTGIASSSRRTLNPLADVPAQVHSVVLFPDDFPGHEVSAYLSVLRTRRSDLTIVIVTREPALYASMTSMDNQPLRATVLPRPAFGWTIIDAIRAAEKPLGQAPRS